MPAASSSLLANSTSERLPYDWTTTSLVCCTAGLYARMSGSARFAKSAQGKQAALRSLGQAALQRRGDSWRARSQPVTIKCLHKAEWSGLCEQEHTLEPPGNE